MPPGIFERDMKKIDRQILDIAIPSIVSNITVPLLGLVDTAIAGHLGDKVFIGAVAVGYQNLLARLMGVADIALDGARSGGQAAQSAATRILALFDGVARQIR